MNAALKSASTRFLARLIKADACIALFNSGS